MGRAGRAQNWDGISGGFVNSYFSVGLATQLRWHHRHNSCLSPSPTKSRNITITKIRLTWPAEVERKRYTHCIQHKRTAERNWYSNTNCTFHSADKLFSNSREKLDDGTHLSWTSLALLKYPWRSSYRFLCWLRFDSSSRNRADSTRDSRSPDNINDITDWLTLGEECTLTLLLPNLHSNTQFQRTAPSDTAEATLTQSSLAGGKECLSAVQMIRQ